ncbi:MAG: hypothetical protein HQK83_14090 [Fibrobacteria bacterium]|nr:hypothetical protein [Fibrobacteria bacterium]
MKIGHFGAIMIPALIFLFSGCNESTTAPEVKEEKRPSAQNLSFLNIVDAKALVIENIGPEGIPKSAAGSADSLITGDTRVSRLYKINEENVYEEVTNFRVDTLLIDEGDSIRIELDTVEQTTSFSPRVILNAGPDFIYASFLRSDDSGKEYDYLVRKSDGAVFQTFMHAVGPDANTYGSLGYDLFQHDENGNLYINSFGRAVIQKVNVENPEALSQENLTSELEQVHGFIVNKKGHILYKFMTPPISSSDSPGFKIRYADGGLRYIDKASGFTTAYWKGFDDCFYYNYMGGNDPNNFDIQIIRKITITGNQAVETDTDTLTNKPGQIAVVEASVGGTRFDLPELNKIFFVDSKSITEVFNNDDSLKCFSTEDLGINSIKLYAASDRYYYLAGLMNTQPVLLKVDPSVFPHTATQLASPGEYDFYKFVVSKDDNITFNALRMSDGKLVLGSVSPAGVFSIQQIVEQQVTQLIRIQ